MDTKYFLVRAVTPRGRFRRCEIQFENTWRPIELAEQFDPHATPPKVDAARFARIKAETVESEREYFELLAGVEPDPELAARLKADATRNHAPRTPALVMRPAESREVDKLLEELELASNTPEKELERERAKNAALQKHVTDMEARLMKLELATPKGKEK